MSKITVFYGAVSLLYASATLAFPVGAAALPLFKPSALARQPQAVEKIDYSYDGRNYCFYPDGWRGPGFYLCGSPYRRGFYFAPSFFSGGRGGSGGLHRGRALGGEGFHRGGSHGGAGHGNGKHGGGKHGGGKHGGGKHGGGKHGGGKHGGGKHGAKHGGRHR